MSSPGVVVVDPVFGDRISPEAAPDICLRTVALAAIAAQLPDRRDNADSPEEQYLREQLWAVGDSWRGALAGCLDEPAEEDLPLIELRRQLGLSGPELLAVALASAVEEDMMVGRALAQVQAPVGGSRPTLGLLAWAFGCGPPEMLAGGAAVASGLLTISSSSAPLPERLVSVPLPAFLALRGQDGLWPGATIGLGATPEVPLPPSILGECQRQARGLHSAERALALRTGSEAEGKSVAAAIAACLDLRPVFLPGDDLTGPATRSAGPARMTEAAEELAGLVPWLLLRKLLPVFCFELAPGERRTLPGLPGYSGPLLALCGPDGSVQTAAGTAPSWTIPVAPRDERRRLWQAALGDHRPADDPLPDQLARQHRHGCGRIAHLGRLARRQAALDGSRATDLRHVLAAAWVGEGGGLDALAQPLPEPIPDEALVLGETLRDSLQGLLLRCRVRDELASGLGASAVARYRAGVRALFVGPSGTGKTLAAGWIATRLGLPLYRVDLASVTSKYIGETEKNLSQLLARAEQAEVVLLFDEADSLFGKRTDVQQANDRFANAQTNYLLQRIESYDGITILTSNSRSRFDAAFSRRLDAVIEFSSPGPAERRRLWQSHLGQNHGLAAEQLNQLAATADLTGGDIRNAVLAAAVLARQDQRPIQFPDVQAGLRNEFRKLGRQMPGELTHAPRKT